MIHLYSIVTDINAKKIAPNKLVDEIEASNITPSLDKLVADGDTLTAYFTSGLSVSEKTVLDGVIQTHDGVDYPPDPDDPNLVQLANPFTDNADSVSFRGEGFTAPVTPGYNNIDVLIDDINTRLINGAEIWTESSSYGETITFQVVDVDNIIGMGEGFVIEQFAEEWQMIPGQKTECYPGYIAAVPPGIYIRARVYASEAGHVYFNLHLHQP